MKKKISVIVPVYNAFNTIERCIMSIINQSYGNLEIIIVDDGSTDKSKKICKNLSKKYNFIKFISKKNGGVSTARNIGISNSSGDFFVFVDADDTIENNLIEELVSHYEPDVLVGPNINRIFLKKNIKNKYEDEYIVEDFIESISNGKIFGGIVGYLFDKKNICFFDEKTNYMEDTLFLLKYLKKIKKVKFVNSYYNYIFSSSSITNASNINSISKNIKNMYYSIVNIDKAILCYDLNMNTSLNLKKISILEAEISKLILKRDLKEILKLKEVDLIILDLKKQKIPLTYKTFYYLIKFKLSNLLFLYNKIRRIMKKLIGGIK